MLLAGDIGGTKTLLGLFERGPAGPNMAQPNKDGLQTHRPKTMAVREYATLDFDSLEELTQVFLEDTRAATSVRAVCIGVAGPVTGLTARLTNVPWLADASMISERLGDCPVRLLNDLEAMAYSVGVLEPHEVAVLQEGIRVDGSNAALIAAGTGLGQALLHNVDGRLVPAASEGGHADFSARSARELALVAQLSAIYGRVDNDRVISGPGLVNIFRFTHGLTGASSNQSCDAIDPNVEDSEMPAAISASAIEGRCDQCAEALDMFVEAYGAEAGNLALRSVARAGVYIGGGIAPKVLPALETGPFMDAFCAKSPLSDLLRTMPVSVILNPAAGLLGAAVRASGM